MVLTTIDQSEATEQARGLLTRSQQAADPTLRRVILELVTTIMVYKFTNSSRQEVEAMLGLNLQETRVYQEAKAEGREEGRAEQARSLLVLLLTQKFGTLPDSVSDRLSTLSVQQLEACAIAFLTFTTLADLEAWLDQQLFP